MADEKQTPRILGLDIGGAALKAADLSGRAIYHPFPLWQQPKRLADELAALMRPFDYERLAVTMTGELCDCFASKSAGVTSILDSVGAAVRDATIDVWQTDERFTDPESAARSAWSTAASNWLALATFVADYALGEPALLIDIGSTTTDIVPIRAGRPVPAGRSDPDRLASGELVYTGVRRTPLCALLPAVHLAGREYRVMAELFATTLDVYLTLGNLAEDESNQATADGRPATRAAARDRLARMIGSDRTRFTNADTLELANAARDRQCQSIAGAIATVLRRSLDDQLQCLIVSGEGEFLMHQVYERVPMLRQAKCISLADRLGPDVSQAGCAFAVAHLLARRCPSSRRPRGSRSNGTPKRNE